MKKILITGANSYIGTSFETYVKENVADRFCTETIDMIGDSWRESSFAGYDAVYHVAGIAHRKETAENADLYYKINRDLAIEVAKKAKREGVRQFIFLSSMSIYGKLTGRIDKTTVPAPKTNYGKSKLMAETEIARLADEHFAVAVLRPPMVYGENCKGNYNAIVRLVRQLPFFPRVNNKRSMIRIENLSSFVVMAIERELRGVYFPQDETYRSATGLAREIAERMHKKLFFSRVLGFFAICMRPFSKTARKAFGNLTYENTEDFGFEYCEKRELK